MITALAWDRAIRGRVLFLLIWNKSGLASTHPEISAPGSSRLDFLISATSGHLNSMACSSRSFAFTSKSAPFLCGTLAHLAAIKAAMLPTQQLQILCTPPWIQAWLTAHVVSFCRRFGFSYTPAHSVVSCKLRMSHEVRQRFLPVF